MADLKQPPHCIERETCIMIETSGEWRDAT
jgi:hypothetical protein